MEREKLYATINALFGVKPDFPWKTYPDYAVFRHVENGKWFALAMEVPAEKLSLSPQKKKKAEKDIALLNLKLSPAHIAALGERDDVLPAYHMNKKHWISLLLEEFPETEIEKLLKESFQKTA